jgi:DNA repair protein RecN (Recombination protein N)
MIEHLAIQNLALLSAVTLEVKNGFTAVTGETGAGKSVLLSALKLLSGEKADKGKIRQGSERCEVVAFLKLNAASPVHGLLEAEGLPPCEEGILCLKRTLELEKSGKAWVNGALVPRQTLEKLAPFWIDFNGPQSPHRLSQESEQRVLLDAFAQTAPELEAYQVQYKVLQGIEKSVQELQKTTALSEDERIFYQEQWEKIHQAVPSEEAILGLEQAYTDQEKQTLLQEHIHALTQGLGKEHGLGQPLRKLLKPAQALVDRDPQFATHYQRLQALIHEVDDLSYEYARALADMPSGEAFADLDGRMNRWLTIQRSHGPTLGHVLARKKALEDKLTSQETVAKQLAELDLQRDATLKALAPLAQALEKKRFQGSKTLSAAVEALLPELGLPKARFEVAFFDEPSYTLYGITRMEFRLATNVGQPLMPLSKVASSGEKARVMLAIKGISAQSHPAITLVFDEIDANVGGEVGVSVGKVMKTLSQHHQVIAITHLPQVAAQADAHIVVQKTQGDASAEVEIESLSPDSPQRISELARMLGDRNLESAKKHAVALMQQS